MVKVLEKNKKETKVLDTIDQLVTKSHKALEEMRELDQNQIDVIVKQMALAGLDNHMTLAKMAIEETGRGVYEDKIIKNLFASEYIYHSIKDNKTIGVINENVHNGTVEIAEPIGVVAGVTPVTNPTSTTIFKSIISIKTGNPIIFAFHPSAQKSSAAAAKALYEAAIKMGAPENCIQWIENPSLEATQALMKHDKVATILATGGPGMVKSAYSSGKPALGVGAGNVPCYIEKTAHVKRATNDLILSKTFDNGMICASEQAVIVDKEIYNDVKKQMTDNGCHYLTNDERLKVEKIDGVRRRTTKR